MNQYLFYFDTGAFDKLAALFEHGMVTKVGPLVVEGKEGILNFLKSIKVYEDGTPKTRHVNSNIDLTIDEDKGTATGRSYVTVLQQTDKLPLQVIFSGYYFDDLERAAGQWRFKQRIIRDPVMGDMSGHVDMSSVFETGE